MNDCIIPSASAKIPVSVIIVTKNEAARIGEALKTLTDFDQVIVVDSNSRDATIALAAAEGAQTHHFTWNGQYPKKRQWCLNHLSLRHDWVLFVDADEVMTEGLITEIAALFKDTPPVEAGFFIKGRYCSRGKILKFGQCNSKIALFNRRKMGFPTVNDLDIPGMGEIEGHYQPVFLPDLPAPQRKIGRLRHFMIHDALDDEQAWQFRHEKYARWEAGMNVRKAWPDDPVPWRNHVKKFLRVSRLRAPLTFLYGYIWRGGFLDGASGKTLARFKYRYYRLIDYLSRKITIARAE